MRSHELIETHEHTNRCWWNHEQARWVCDTGDRSGDAPLVDVRDMIVVHTAMLREFRLAPASVRRTAPGDTKQAGVVARHLHFICDLLHHHHAGEDELLWPTLRTRLSRAEIEIVEAVEAQHDAIDGALGRTGELVAAWNADPVHDAGEQLAAQLETLYALLRDHLELEEQALLPLAAARLTAPEWHAVGEAAVATMSKGDLALSFGMFAYEGDPAVLRDMLASAPPPVRVLMPRLAPRLYARRARAVHGTSQP